jgi:PAS domain S-box-containing protein
MRSSLPDGQRSPAVKRWSRFPWHFVVGLIGLAAVVFVGLWLRPDWGSLLLAVGLAAAVLGGSAALWFQQRAANAATARQDDILRQVNHFAHQLLAADQPSRLFDSVCQLAGRIAQADRALLLLYAPGRERLRLAGRFGWNPPLAEVEEGIAGDATARAVFHRSVSPLPAVEIPLSSSGEPLGLLVVYSNHPGVSAGSENELLQILAAHLTAAVDCTQLQQTVEVQSRSTQQFIRLSHLSTFGLPLNRAATDMAEGMRQLLNADWAIIGLFDQLNEQIEVVGYSTLTPAEEAHTFPLHIPIFPELMDFTAIAPTRFNVITLDSAGVSARFRSYLESFDLQASLPVSLAVEETPFGVLIFGWRRSRAITPQEEQIIEAAANQISTLVHNARLHQDTLRTLQRNMEQITTIRDIIQNISNAQDVEKIIDNVLESSARATGADLVRLALLTRQNDLWVIEQHYRSSHVSRSSYALSKTSGTLGQVLQSGETQIIPDTQGVPDYLPSPHGAFRSVLTVPLRWKEAIVGILSAEHRSPHAFTEEHIGFLQNFGAHAIISIENARLLDELEYQIDVLSSLRELSLALASEVETRNLASRIVKTAIDLMESDYASLFEYKKPDGPALLLDQSVRGTDSLSFAQLSEITEMIRQVTETGEMRRIDTQPPVGTSTALATHYESLIVVPVQRGDQVDRALCLGYKTHRVLEDRDQNTLSLLAIQASGHLENAALHQQLHDVNNRLRTILDSTKDGVILLDEYGRIAEVNPSAQRLMGFDLREHLGEALTQVLLQRSEADEGQAGYSRDELIKLARIERLKPEGITRREFARQLSSNQVLYVEEIGSPVRDERSQSVGRLLVLRDITEEKKLEEYRNEITGMAVHDLRAPLAGIINALKLAQEHIDQPGGSGRVKRALTISRANADKMMDLVNTMLDIRKGREMSLERVPTAIDDLIELARLAVILNAEKANITIDVVIPPNLPLVNIDQDKLRRVLVNLLDNALRFTPEGATIQVSVQHIAERGKLRIRVADSGPGIPPKDRNRVFEQYWQSKDHKPLRGSKGSGIGLAFCKRVLEAHGEDIWVEPVGPLPGASFAFTLPVM